MKAWEIIGWAYDGALYHDGCEPDVPEQTDDTEGKTPIFACEELSPDDYCDHCLHTWIAENPTKPATRGWASHVYLIERS